MKFLCFVAIGLQHQSLIWNGRPAGAAVSSPDKLCCRQVIFWFPISVLEGTAGIKSETAVAKLRPAQYNPGGFVLGILLQNRRFGYRYDCAPYDSPAPQRETRHDESHLELGDRCTGRHSCHGKFIRTGRNVARQPRTDGGDRHREPGAYDWAGGFAS